MRILSPVVTSSARDVPSLHAKITQSRAIGWQFVRYNCGWTKALWLQQFPHQFHGRALVPARLHQDVQDLAFAIDGTPKINALAVNLDEDFIEMPARIGAGMRLS